MTENESNFFKANAELIILGGLVLMCGAVYAQAVGFQFINFDDNYYVYENPVVLSGLNWNSIKWAFTAFHSANWHPLTWISHMADVSLFGKNAGAHHATNVLFHIINSFLVFVVLRKMTGCLWSAIVAALFAIHPAHVESVAWISERKDVLSTLFWLLTMLAYFSYAKGDAETRRRGDAEKEIAASPRLRVSASYILTIVLFALGLMSKPMLVTLPFVLLLCDYWALERLKTLKDLKPLVVEKLPLFVLSAISAYITILAQKSGGAVQTLDALPFGTRFVNAVIAYAKYIVMLFYPVDLGAAYPYQATFPAWQILGSLALLAGITALCVWQRRERKYLLMGWLFFLGTLVPVIGIVQVGAQSMADRYTYVPYIGLFIMIVWGAGEIFGRLKLNKIVAAAIVSVVLLALSVLCFKQVSYWRNGEILYKHTLDAGQGNYIIKHNYCNFLLHENRPAEAEPKCLAALAENPSFADSYNTLGISNVKTGKLENAVANFKKAIELKPGDPTIYTNLAAAVSMLGNPDEAAQNLFKAQNVYAKSGADVRVMVNPFKTLAGVYASRNEFEKASKILAHILQIAPESGDVRANYALSLYFQNKFDEARREIEQAIRQNPNQAESYNTFGMILLKQNKPNEAAAQFEKALQLKPELNEARENLGKLRNEK